MDVTMNHKTVRKTVSAHKGPDCGFKNCTCYLPHAPATQKVLDRRAERRVNKNLERLAKLTD